MSKLENLIEQTSFLLEKQKETTQDCLTLFADLLSTVDKRLKQSSKEKEEVEALESVRELLSDQAEQIKQGSQEDIDFLAEQLESLQQIKAVNDPAKAKELLGLLVDEDVEIKDTATFKKEVIEEATISRQNLVVMLNDIKEAIQEGNAQDVAVYLESVLNGTEEGEDEDADECDEECCSGHSKAGATKAKSSCSDCGKGCCKEFDLFESLELYEEAPEKKSTNKTKKS